LGVIFSYSKGQTELYIVGKLVAILLNINCMELVN